MHLNIFEVPPSTVVLTLSRAQIFSSPLPRVLFSEFYDSFSTLRPLYTPNVTCEAHTTQLGIASKCLPGSVTPGRRAGQVRTLLYVGYDYLILCRQSDVRVWS